MPEPHEVNPSNFQVRSIIWDKGGFAIAWGTWREGNMRLGMRWNGPPDHTGFPQAYGRSVWLVIPDELTLPILGALLGTGSVVADINVPLSEAIKQAVEMQP